MNVGGVSLLVEDVGLLIGLLIVGGMVFVRVQVHQHKIVLKLVKVHKLKCSHFHTEANFGSFGFAIRFLLHFTLAYASSNRDVASSDGSWVESNLAVGVLS